MTEVDLLVVGLGPAGASAAKVAAVSGLKVLAIDKKQSVGKPVQCAEFVPMPMLGHCQSEGVLCQPIQTMTTYLPSRIRSVSEFPGLMVDRARFDQAIATEAVRSGARLLLKARLVALDLKRHEATIESAGMTRQIVYHTLVAADGPRSTVARLIGFPVLACVQTRQYTVPLRQPYDDTNVWLSDECPGGYAWLFPKGTEANLGLGADRRYESDLKAPLERLHRQLVAEDLVGPGVLARTGGEIPVGGLRASLVHESILFAGDAAGLTHPITGAGIAAAVISGERAGAAVCDLLIRKDEDALRSYEEDVRDQFEDTLARAVVRRRWLDRHWRTPSAGDDRIMRRGWIAFPEYFADHAPQAPGSTF